jgi:hypothetical protein
MARIILVLSILALAACGATKKTMKNCEATPDPKVFVNCEEMD